jgi:hypothetical protein
VLAVTIGTDDVRRPVMLNKDSKVALRVLSGRSRDMDKSWHPIRLSATTPCNAAVSWCDCHNSKRSKAHIWYDRPQVLYRHMGRENAGHRHCDEFWSGIGIRAGPVNTAVK